MLSNVWKHKLIPYFVEYKVGAKKLYFKEEPAGGSSCQSVGVLICLYIPNISFKNFLKLSPNPNWGRTISSPVSDYNPIGLWIPNVSICNNRVKLNKDFFKSIIWCYICNLYIKFVPFIYNFRKKIIHKIVCPAVKRWDIFIISRCINMTNERE